jgi:aminoglycoside phosphotransferase (APT) family kinase protein
MNSELLDFLRAAELAGPRETPRAEALPGGVSSDIWRVELASGTLCVKRALPQLKVAREWKAPVERNAYECAWYRIAGQAVAGAAPRVLAQGQGMFAMEYLEPESHPVWKSLLRRGHADPEFSSSVGGKLAAIHAATAGRKEIAERFPTDAIFHAIRLEPYLEATAEVHTDLHAALHALSRNTFSRKISLVHGDVSPKNILAGPRGPVFLDAECAWYGDPAFDLAFCLNHLLLKCVWVPQATSRFLACFDALAGSYLSNVTWEAQEDLEARTAHLLPALMLARVDGKSPVEYVTQEAEKNAIRKFARGFLEHPRSALFPIRQAWPRSLM